MRYVRALLAVALAGAALAAPTAAGTSAGYIIVLADSVADPGAVAAEHAESLGLEVGFVYRDALKGYSALVPEAALDDLRAEGRVAYVEADAPVHASATQPNPTWGLDRIDQRTLPLSSSYTYAATGAGVTAYVIDTGIRKSHQEFGGRALHGYDAILGLTSEDCMGHGTHVAATIGGATYGVAKAVRLVAVRVLDCAGVGLTSWVIAGIDWVTRDHDPGEAAVANMSLGGGKTNALDQAVKNSIADGVTYAVAAGNESEDACTGSPSNVPEAITVGATDSADRRADFSDFGPCVDWFAPGVDITSAWWLTNTMTLTISGTSMASPHTAGVAALYLQGNPAASPQQVRDALYTLTTKDAVLDARSANDHLLFTNL